LVPKLVRWGIDAHMGILFGWPNQLLMATGALSLMFVIVYGYVIWWKRNPRAIEPLTRSWKQLPVWLRVVWLLVAITLGWALPLVGASLMAFIVIDMLLAKRTHTK
jgi:uncharacterized iron-regulated membrane protein